jgi:hypothetical protein
MSLDQYTGREQIHLSFSRSYLSVLPSECTAATVLLYTSSCGPSYSIWSDQALAILARQPSTFAYRRPPCLLEYTECDSLTVFCLHVSVYKVRLAVKQNEWGLDVFHSLHKRQIAVENTNPARKRGWYIICLSHLNF